MNTAYGLLFNRKTGKVIKAIEGSLAMVKSYPMANPVSKTRDYLVLNAETGFCEAYFEGRGSNVLPKICKDMVGKSYKDFNISIEDIKALFFDQNNKGTENEHPFPIFL